MFWLERRNRIESFVCVQLMIDMVFLHSFFPFPFPFPFLLRTQGRCCVVNALLRYSRCFLCFLFLLILLQLDLIRGCLILLETCVRDTVTFQLKKRLIISKLSRSEVLSCVSYSSHFGENIYLNHVPK
jgi:hypothetical protein